MLKGGGELKRIVGAAFDLDAVTELASQSKKKRKKERAESRTSTIIFNHY